MKKFLKGLRFVLCYLAITFATATGVVIYTANSMGNVSNGNTTTNGQLTQIDNNLMEVVSNMMSLESFNLDSTIALKDKTSANPINLDIDFDINLGTNLSSIDAQGSLNILYNNKPYDIDIKFVDNTFFVSALGKDISFTTDGLMTGISSVLTLLDIEIPLDSSMMENFDVTSLLGFMGEYKEVETETGYNITLEFMGYNISMVCDKEFNLQTVSIPSMAVEGFEIDINAGLTPYTETIEISKPQKAFLNLDTITSLAPIAGDIINHKFVKADITAAYQDYYVEFDAKADFAKAPTVFITTPLLKGIDIAYQNETAFISVGNIKLKGTLNDLESILTFFKEDMKANLDSVDPTIVSTITNKTQDLSTSVTKELENLDLDKILDYIDYLSTTKDQIVIAIPNLCDIVISTKDNTITSITATAGDFEIVIDNISFESEDIIFDTKDFIEVEKVLPTAKKFINTLFTKGVSGSLNINGIDEHINYAMRYTTHFETSFDTTILGKDISLVSDNAKLYAAVDGIKLNINLAEYQTILDYLKDTFGINIEIPQITMPEISPELIAGLSLNFIDYIKPITNGIEVSIEGIIIQVACNENYLRNITVITNGDTISLDITGYGDVELFDIEKTEYIVFEDITNYIDDAIKFADHKNFATNISLNTTIDGKDIYANVKGKFAAAGTFATQVSASYGDMSFENIVAMFDGSNFSITYEDLTAYVNNATISKVKDLLVNVIPSYVDIDKLLKTGNLDLNALKDNASKISLPTVNIAQIILACESITLTQDTLTLVINLADFDDSINANATITIKSLNGAYIADVAVNYEGIVAKLKLAVYGCGDFDTTLPKDAICANDYLDFVKYAHNTIDSNNLSLGITANIDGQNLTANALVDFRDGLKAQIIANAFDQEVKLAYSTNLNKLLIATGNLKLSTKYSDLDNLIDFVQNDLNNTLLAYGIDILAKADTAITTNAQTTNNQITFADVKDILTSIKFTDNTITFVKDDINVTLTIANETITNVSLVYGDINICIAIQDNTQDVIVDETGYVAFEDIFPTIKNLSNTLFTKGISGELTLAKGSETFTLNYAIRYTTHLEVSLDTVILDKQVSIVTDATQIYLAVDGVKLTVNINEYQTIIDYLNETFGLNIVLPKIEVPTTDIATLIPAMLTSVESLKVINNGIEISAFGIVAQVISKNEKLSNITIILDGNLVSLDITGYGDVELFDIEKTEYLVFEDITNYIDNAQAFVKNTDFDYAVYANATIDNNIVVGDIKGKVSTNGNATADIYARYNDTVVDFDASLTNDAIVVSYDGLNVYAKQTAISALENLLVNVIPNYVDINKLLKDNNINLEDMMAQGQNVKVPTIDIASLVIACDTLSLTKDTLTLSIDLAKYDSAINAYVTLTITALNNGYVVAINVSYNNNPIYLQFALTQTQAFKTEIPANAINVEDYLNLVETISNTVDSYNYALDITASAQGYTVDADVIADFTNGINLNLYTESLGSDLNITYADSIGKLLVTFGNLKISGEKQDIADILEFVKGDLNNVLVSYGINALDKFVNNLTKTPAQETQDMSITFEDIKDVLYSITFTNDTITFVKDNILITLTTYNKTIININFVIDDIEVNIGISDNKAAVNTDQTGFTAFADILNNAKALTKSLSSKAIGATANITYDGVTYTGDIKVNYIGDVLVIGVTTDMYGQSIAVTITNNTVYVKVNELMLKAAWAERYDLQFYLNSKFGLKIDIDKIVEAITDSMSSEDKKAFELEDINVDFIGRLVATSNGLNMEAGNTPVSITIGKYNDSDDNFITSIYTKVEGVTINLNNMVYGADAIVPNINDNDYKNYEAFTDYFDEVERLINASKDESLNQYTLRGNAKVYKLNSTEEISINIPTLQFDATKNTFVGGISATGAGNLYTDYLSGYDHALSVYYDYNFMYFDYNGMRIKFSKQSNAEFITNLKKAVPHYIGGKLGSTITELLDMVRFDTTGNMLFNPIDTSGITKDIGKYVEMLSTLRLNDDNSLTIGIDISSMVPSFAEEILINVMLDAKDKLSLTINKLKITDELYIDFTLFVDTIGEFSAVPPTTDANGKTISYMDMTSIGKFLGDIDNTIQKTKDGEAYNINVSGSLNVKLTIIGININEAIPFNAQLTIDPTKQGSIIEAKIYLDMFENLLLNGTKDIKTTLYITDRLEGESIMYIHRTGNELKSKYKTSELGNNIIRVLSDITNISEDTLSTIVSMELTYIEGPTKVENVLKEYLYSATGLTNRSYTIGLDLQQLSLLEMMVPYTNDNPTSIKLNVVNNALSSISLTDVTLQPLGGINVYASANIDLSNLTQSFDIVSEIESLDPYAFGSWNDGSLTVSFEENGGSAVSNRMSKTGRTVALPTPTKEVLSADGNKLSVYKFIGWNDSINLDGNVYVDSYLMGTTSVTLYAMWQWERDYNKYTLTFDSDICEYATSITDFEGYNITDRLPNVPDTVTKYYEAEGVSVTYNFEGWYKTRTQNEDGSYKYADKFEQTVMPNESLTVYAKWTEIDRVYQRKLTIYDAGVAKYTNYFTEGSTIDVSSYISYKDTTKWYIDATANNDADNFDSEVSVASLPTVMPENDLIIRIKNKYKLTFKSDFGNKTTKYVEAYQEEDITSLLPTQSDYEVVVYTDGSKANSTIELHNNMSNEANNGGKIPNYLETYVYGGYLLSTDTTVTAPTVMPNSNKTYVANWTYISTSFYKLTFGVGWQKPGWWAPTVILPMREQIAPGYVCNEYVLAGSTLNKTTLTKKTSLIGLTADISVSKYTTCRYKYGANYDFEVVGWNTNGAAENVYDGDCNNSFEINKSQDFHVVWGHC